MKENEEKKEILKKTEETEKLFKKFELNEKDNNLEEESIFIKMFNTSGQEVFFKSYDTNNNFINEKLDVSHLLKGIYFLNASNSNKIQKIIIN